MIYITYIYIYIYNYVHICIYMHRTYRIRYSFLKILVFEIFFFLYCILIFDLLHRVTDIHIFWFKSKRVTNRIKIYKYFDQLYP